MESIERTFRFDGEQRDDSNSAMSVRCPDINGKRGVLWRFVRAGERLFIGEPILLDRAGSERAHRRERVPDEFAGGNVQSNIHIYRNGPCFRTAGVFGRCELKIKIELNEEHLKLIRALSSDLPLKQIMNGQGCERATMQYRASALYYMLGVKDRRGLTLWAYKKGITK